MSDVTLTHPEPLAPINGRPSGPEALEAELAAVQHRLAALEAILNDLPLGVFMADAKTGLPQFVNKAGLELLGRGVNPQRGNNDSTEVYRTFLPRSNQPYPVQDLPIVRTMATGQPAHGEMDIQQAERRVTVNVKTIPIRDPEGRVVSAVAVYQPIADQPPLEMALLESQPIFHTFIEASGSVPYRRDHNAGRYTYMGEGIRALTGYSPEEMTTQILESLIQENIPMGEAKVYGSLAEAVEQAQSGQLNTWRSDMRIKTRDGQTRWLSDASIEIKDATGASIGSIGILQDITERKQAEQVLHEREEDLTALLEFSPEAIGVVNTQTGLFESVNLAAERLYGLLRDELVKVGPAQMSPEFQPDGRPSLDAALEKIGAALQGGRPVFEWMHRNAAGQLIPCEIRLVGLSAPRQHLVRFSATDITERKQVEEERRFQASLLAAQNEASIEGVLIVTADGRKILNFNQRFAQLWELPQAVVETRVDAEVLRRVADQVSNFDEFLAKVQYLYQHPEESSRDEIHLKNGRIFDRYTGPIKDGENIHGRVWFFRDITERKQADAALGKRAAELEVVAQVGTAAATILDPSQLLQTVVELTKSNFKLYHAHVYTLNETGDMLELAAGAGEVGHKMVSQGWRIPSNREQSLVARAARIRQGLIVNDVREAPDFLPNPLLPDTRSEMALPIIASDRVLGVLDVQADEPNHFTDEDLRIQGILATQIAVALQNARQFAEARRLTDRETLVNSISQQIQNATTVESALQIAARELGRALGAQRTVVQLGQSDKSPR